MAETAPSPLYPYRRSADQDAARVVRHPVVVVGAGPVGLAAAVDLAQQRVPVVVVDENDDVSTGSRAICFAKRPLEILDRLGCGDACVDHGVTWHTGKVFCDTRLVYQFDLQPEEGHKRPAFVNLPQRACERFLVQRVRRLRAAGYPIDLRGANVVTAVEPGEEQVELRIDTPDGAYRLAAEWVLACDGAGSTVRQRLGLDFVGRTFEDNFLIADVMMQASFPTERWFWFDPPFNRGRSALLHRQPDNVWRIDLQLGRDIDRAAQQTPEAVGSRLRAMLGENTPFELRWVSIYTFRCCRMERFRHGRVIFAGDAAHQVSPFGARGANSGFQDTDNLGWKLKLVLEGRAPESLLDSYEAERIPAADENIVNSTRSTEFITPKSEVSRRFRDAVLDLAARHDFARPLVNSGRLSVPSVYDGSPLNGPDAGHLPAHTRPGAPAIDAPVSSGWLIDQLGDRFVVLSLGTEAPDGLVVDGIPVSTIRWEMSQLTRALRDRYLGSSASGVYLMRPDQHVAARWPTFDERAVQHAVRVAVGNG